MVESADTRRHEKSLGCVNVCHSGRPTKRKEGATETAREREREREARAPWKLEEAIQFAQAQPPRRCWGKAPPLPIWAEGRRRRKSEGQPEKRKNTAVSPEGRTRRPSAVGTESRRQNTLRTALLLRPRTTRRRGEGGDAKQGQAEPASKGVTAFARTIAHCKRENKSTRKKRRQRLSYPRTRKGRGQRKKSKRVYTKGETILRGVYYPSQPPTPTEKRLGVCQWQTYQEEEEELQRRSVTKED